MRAEYTAKLFFEDTYSQITSRLTDLAVVIANEYYLHEAGHFLGYDVLDKYRDGYFLLDGKTAWPLIYLEELRADLQAFGFALSLLSAQEATQIFLYNFALRFGVQREGITRQGIASYGLVPYFLFCILWEIGFLTVVNIGQRYVLRLASLKTEDLVSIMHYCASHAESELTASEIATRDSFDRALVAARYIRKRLDDTAAVNAYAQVLW
jgi:hypothetical protein